MYEFIPNPLESIPFISKCEFEIGGATDYIGEFYASKSRNIQGKNPHPMNISGSSNISEEHVSHATSHGVPLDCTWIIRAEENKKIYLQFTQYELQMPNDCNYNFIQVFDGKTDVEHRKHYFCGSVADSYVSESDVLYVR